MKTIELNHAAAAHHHRHERGAQCIHVIGWQRCQQSIVLINLTRSLKVVVPDTHDQEILVGQHATLGLSGGAGGV